jgi:hypothetical protein
MNFYFIDDFIRYTYIIKIRFSIFHKYSLFNIRRSKVKIEWGLVVCDFILLLWLLIILLLLRILLVLLVILLVLVIKPLLLLLLLCET